MDPLLRAGEFGHGVADAGAVEVDVRDEGVEAVAVVIDAQPDHVPAGVVAVAYAEDGEFRLVDAHAGAPPEAKRAALGVDVSGRPVGEELVVAALEEGALGAAGEDSYVLEVVGVGLAGGVVGFEAVVAGEVEEEAGFGRGWCVLCGGEAWGQGEQQDQVQKFHAYTAPRGRKTRREGARIGFAARLRLSDKTSALFDR